jgi:hypothetical protein
MVDGGKFDAKKDVAITRVAWNGCTFGLWLTKEMIDACMIDTPDSD